MITNSAHRHPQRRVAGDPPVLCERDQVPDEQVNAFIHDALDEIRIYMQSQGVTPAGPPFSVCARRSSGLVDVEVGWPLDQSMPGTARIHSGTLPRTAIRARRSEATI